MSTYKISSKSEFGNVLYKLMEISYDKASSREIKEINSDEEVGEVECSEYGFSLLRLWFPKFEYEIEKIKQN